MIEDWQYLWAASCRPRYVVPVYNDNTPSLHGIETTAYALSATLGFLSIHEGIQEEVYEEIVSVIGHDRDPVCVFHSNLSLDLTAGSDI